LMCTIYSNFYFSKIIDFSEAINLSYLIIRNVIIFMTICFLYFGIKQAIKKEFVADFLFNTLAVVFSIACTFIALTMKDPEFKNPDTALMVDFYKGFIMPMIFFPVLSWFALKPLFFRN
jgi:hypothetical protein